MTRKRLTNSQKLIILADVDERHAGGESLGSIARSHGIQTVQIKKWRSKMPELAATKRTKKSLSRGNQGRLGQFEEQLVGWALDRQHKGLPFLYSKLMQKAYEFNPELRNLTLHAQYQVVRRLCIRNCIVKRRVTHQAQEHPQDTIDRSLQWLAIMRPIVSAPTVQQKFVINMDQTAVFLSMHPQTTLALEGSTTVYRRKTVGGGAHRFTCSLAISANGDKLKPFLIFKGTPDGRIATREFPTNPHRNLVQLVCQESAWQDEENMLRWIDLILVPYLQEKAAGVPAILLLDRFSVHWTARVQGKLSEIGISLYGIPAGCTSLVQPIDVGIGKPFKDCLRNYWWDWTNEQNVEDTIFPAPSREEGSEWVAQSWDTIGADIVKASWRKSDYSFFLQE